MKEFNKELSDDIALLKALHAKKDKSEFNAFKDELMNKHSISKATLYREMRKDMPGTYKVPNYNPPKMDITIEEALMVRELLLQGRQNQEIMKIMTRELGIHYYWDRFDSARKIAEELDESVYDPNRSYFPERSNMFFEKLMGMEFMAEESYKEFEIDGRKLRVTKKTMEMLKVYLMRDNPISGESQVNRFLQNEVTFHAEMEEGIRRKLYQMHKTGEMPSAYALKSIMETKQIVERRESAIMRARKKLIEERQKLEEDRRIQEELEREGQKRKQKRKQR
ncbi:MAG: hypothetical protein IT280_04735 [Ignavibacteria bacterium]|nr:hypothetical protein [Ignavibacteria bacterium]